MPIKNTYITATDQFCGAGGTSSGLVAAGIEVKMALNHWELAIETHNTNHPNTDHDCTDIQACDPRRYPSTNILSTSPECTNQSNANGKKKPKSQIGLWDNKPDATAERSRATMWDVVRFAEYHQYEIVIVENVVEARDWRLYPAWLQAMYDLGFKHKCLYLNSMFFHPCPQSRDRLYIVFWKKGNKAPDLEYRPIGYCPDCNSEVETYQSWKKSAKKWGKYKRQYVYRCADCTEIMTPYYYAAFNAIDWSIKGKRIGDRKTPLSPKTIARIEHGIEKYWTNESVNPALTVTNQYSSGIDCRVKDSTKNPIPTQTGHPNHAMLLPFLTRSEHTKIPIQHQVKSAKEASWTQATRQTWGVCMPFIAELRNKSTARTTQEALSTFSTSGAHHLLVGNYSPGWTRMLDKQMGTITTCDHHGLLTSEAWQSFLSYYYSGHHQNSTPFEAVGTLTTNDRVGIVTNNGKTINVEDCYYRMLKHNEIQKGMAFPDDYIVLGTSKQKVKQLGNAVTPPVMEWIAVQCVKSLER